MLLKNVIKTLRKKWMQLVAIGFIIILSSATYTMMFYGLSGIEEPTEAYLSDYNQELSSFLENPQDFMEAA